MKIISTRLHGILDYATAFILILPWIVDYHPTSEDTWILAASGTFIFIYSIITNYEVGMLKLLPMKGHMILDVLVSAFLIVAPFIFSLPHYTNWTMIVGVVGLITTVLSTATPYKFTGHDLNITKPDT